MTDCEIHNSSYFIRKTISYSVFLSNAQTQTVHDSNANY